MNRNLVVLMGITLLSCAGARPAANDSRPAANDSRPGAIAQSPETVAIPVAEAWLAKADAGQYLETWDDAAEVFRSGILRDDWPWRIARVRTPLGKVIGRKLLSAKYTDSPSSGPPGKYVYIEFETTFENRKGVETVTPMLDPDGKWRVSGYFVHFPRQ